MGDITSEPETRKLALNEQLTNQPSKKDIIMFHQNIRGLTINKIYGISIKLNNKPVGTSLRHETY